MPVNDTTLRFSSPPDSPPVIQLASMVDIVLLLICFYLFVAKSVSEADDPTVALPVIATDATQAQQPAQLVINLRGDGTLLVDGRAVPLDDLSETLAASLSASRASVVVRADRTRPFGELHRIQEACRQMGVDAVVLRTVEED